MQRAKLKFMNLLTTICVTRLRRDSGKERHYQASYSPPAGYALFQHSRAKRITRSLKENAAPPFGSRLVPGTMGVWPGMERKKADCRSRWKTFKPRILARGKQKRLGWRIAAAAPAPTHPRSPGRAGRAGAGGDRGAAFGLRSCALLMSTRARQGAGTFPTLCSRVCGSVSGLWARSSPGTFLLESERELGPWRPLSVQSAHG